MSTKYIQSNTLYLSGSGVIVGATSISLTNLTDIYDNVLTMADFGDLGYITLEPDTSNEEAATFTGITANTNGTYTLTGVKTVLAKSPYTQTAGLVRSHQGGTKVVITDNVAFWDTFTNKANDETITGTWTFNNFPITPSTPNASTTVIGMTKLSSAPVSAVNPIAVGDTDIRVPVAYSVDAAGSDTYVITPSPAITAYAAGQEFSFKAGTANTGACTINVSGLGAKTIKKNVSSDLETGDILLNQIVTLKYDGTNMQMVSNLPSNAPVVNTYLNAASPATWTKPTGLKYVTVQLWAGGGSGGSNVTGSGGGGGAYNTITLPAASLGTTETVTIGAGGTSSTGATGKVGENSSFGSWMTVYGGGGGFASGGAGNADAGGGGGGIKSVGVVGTSSGGAGGAPIGGAGGNAAVGAGSIFGGGGGGDNTFAGGESVYGGGGGGGSANGVGGNSYYGGAGGGGGGVSAVSGGTSTYGGAGGAGGDASPVPTAGAVPGGGGGGSNDVTVASGAGGAGKVIVTEFY